MSRKPLSLDDFNVNLRRHVDARSPTPLRMMAAKGVIPMAPQELALVCFQLSFDKDGKVARTALDTMLATPDDLLTTAASAALPPGVLDWFAEVIGRREPLVNALILNGATPPETIIRLAKSADAAQCDLVAENQVRLLRHPKIIETLYMNPRARMSTVDKLIDLARRNGAHLDGLPALRPLLEGHAQLAEVFPDDELADEDTLFAQFLMQGLEEEALSEDAQGDDEALDLLLLEGKGDGDGDDEVSGRSRAHYISQLSVSGKIRLATLGSGTDRGILIRDTNRLVHMAAVASPKNNDKDALAWSSNRSMPEGVITFIANRREWIRHYQVKLNLVNNPKLPLQKSLRLLNFLMPRDLRLLSTNRNIPNTLQRQAKALAQKRATRGG